LLNEILALKDEYDIETGRLITDPDASKANSREWLKDIRSRMNVIKSNYEDENDEYKTNQKLYQEQIDLINQRYEAQSRVNKMAADQIAGKVVTDEAEAMDDLAKKAIAAEEAVGRLYEMFGRNKITSEQLFDALQANELARVGSNTSRNSVLRAINQRKSKETKKEISDYGTYYNTYEKLKQKELSGERLTKEEDA